MLTPHPSTLRPLRRAGYVTLALLLPVAYGALMRQGRGAVVVHDRSEDALCQLYQRTLDRVTAQHKRAPTDHRLSVRLARLHLVRAYVLAAAAYEQQHRSVLFGQMEADDQDEYTAWRRRFLATDPEQALTDTLRAVRVALQQDPPAQERLQLLSVLGFALCFLGRHREEVAALREAAHIAPDPDHFSNRLALAHAEAGQFRQAEAVLRAGDRRTLLRSHSRAVPPGPKTLRSP